MHLIVGEGLGVVVTGVVVTGVVVTGGGGGMM